MPKDRSERIGLIVSGGGHLALLLWALLGGIFFRRDMPPPVAATEVSLMSSKDFAALQAKAPTAASESPAQPSAPKPAEKPLVPKKDSKPKKETPAKPEKQPEPDAAPEVTDLTPPAAEVTDTPPTPQAAPVEETSPTVAPDKSPRPEQKAAKIVAPTPSDAPKPDAEVADTTQAQTTPTPTDTPTPEKPKKETAPQDSGEVLLTEANKDQTKTTSSAPVKSSRPKPKPEKKPAPAEPASAPEDTQTATADTGATDVAVNDALAEALSGAASDTPSPGTGVAPSGPPLTSGEKDALIVAVKQCWNVGALSTDALRTVVTVGVSMGQDGKPDGGSIHMIGFEGGSEASAQQAYEAGRRAILRCAKEGYPLPADKYDQWREIEIVFNPDKMRMR